MKSCLLIVCCLAALTAGAAPRPEKIETGVAAYTFRHLTAFEAIEKTKECGGEVIELFTWQKLSPENPKVVLDANLSDEHIAALKAKLQATGIRAVNAYFNNAPFQDKAGPEAGARKLFEFARKLGLRGLTGEPPVEQLDLVEKLVKEYDIQLCFHNHPKNPKRLEYKNWDPAYLLTLMEKRDPRMGFSVDTGHLSRSGVDPVETIKLFKGRVLSVHLKDVKEAKPESGDLPYGQGIANIAGVLAELKRQDFRGHLAVEYEHTTDHLLDDVKHCLNFMRTHLKPAAKLTGMMKDSPVTFPEKGALPSKYSPDVTTERETPEKEYAIFGTPQRSLAQIAKIQVEMVKGTFTPPKPDWTYLKRTHRVLTEGGDLYIFAMGDSIVADTMRSGWVAKLAEAYPKAKIRASVYVRGGGGCQHYKEEGRIAKNVIPRKPDLLFIGGISQRSADDIRECIHQLRAGLPDAEILLANGGFGSEDPREPATLAKVKDPAGFTESLKKLAVEERCAFLDMRTPWIEYMNSAKVHPHIFYRDRVHANEFGEQILSKILLAFFKPVEAVEPWLQARLDWFQDMRFGFMLHWGAYSQWGCIESWPLVEVDKWARPDDLPAWVERGKDMERFKRDYFALNKTFNPTRFDPHKWARAAKQAGMKYVVFTTKHHDGFSMFDTKQTDYRVTHPDCPYSRHRQPDVVRDVFAAFRREGFGIGAYFSKSDWQSPDYWSPDAPARTRNPNYDTLAEPARWGRFQKFVYGQIEELVTGYGPVDILWLDGGQVRPPKQDINMDRIATMARQHQPCLIIVDRTVGGKYENYQTPEQQVPAKPMDYVWESCITMGDQWSFKPGDKYKSPRQLIHLLVDVVAKGGNLLLNVGPQPDGELPAEALSRLKEIGEWMAVNSEAIYSTRPIAPYKLGRVCLTRKGRTVYAIYLAADGETAPPAKIVLPKLPLAKEATIQMLGVRKPLKFSTDDTGLTVESPKSAPCRHAFVLKTTVEP